MESELVAPEGMIVKFGVVASADARRLEQCNAASVYRVHKDHAEKPHGGMWWGIILHRFLEYATERGHDAARDYIKGKKWDALKRTCMSIDLDALPHGNAEVGYAHNPLESTARRLFGGYAVRQCDKETEQFGKADLSIDAQEGFPRPLIGDYKSGDIEGQLPLESTQMLGLGTSRMRAEDLEELDLSLIRVHSSGELDWVTQTMTQAHAAAWENRARRVQLKVIQNRIKAANGVSPDFRVGENCEYCDLRPVCPEHK
jgi:hypothetical protein